MGMVARRQGVLSLAMIAIMLFAVQIPLANELGRAENGIPTYTSTSCSSAIRPIDSAIHAALLNALNIVRRGSQTVQVNARNPTQ